MIGRLLVLGLRFIKRSENISNKHLRARHQDTTQDSICSLILASDKVTVLALCPPPRLPPEAMTALNGACILPVKFGAAHIPLLEKEGMSGSNRFLF